MLMTVPTWLSYDFSPAVWILLAVALVAVIWLLAVCLPLISKVVKRVSDDHDSLAEDAADSSIAYPPVSVIIYACGNSRTLPSLAEAILSQDYPTPFEVVVVNDGADHMTHDAMQRLMLSHPNLYMTFVPEQSRSLSRRKLSLTLGIKAAEYDTVLLTRGNCMVNSPIWLKAMMRHIARGSEVVVGHTVTEATDPAEDRCRLRRIFDETWQTLTYLPRAMAGRPYRATGCNLAYARHLFFDNKGFSRSLHIKGGDDDIFVAEIAKGRDCTVELSPEATLTAYEDSPRQAHGALMKERLFSDSSLPKGQSLLMGSFSLSSWLWLLASAGAIALGLPSLLPVGFFVITAALLVIITIKWRRAIMSLCQQKLTWSIPFLIFWHPFYHLSHKVRAKRHSKENFTWN